jgi:hypothetical protein
MLVTCYRIIEAGLSYWAVLAELFGFDDVVSAIGEEQVMPTVTFREVMPCGFVRSEYLIAFRPQINDVDVHRAVGWRRFAAFNSRRS